MATLTPPVYDSAVHVGPLARACKDVVRSRELLLLLIGRELSVRYKRSVLGIWWTVLNPLLAGAILYAVFSQIFRFETGGTPYAVYVLSGTLVVTFFGQALLGAGGSVVDSSPVLSKIYAPPEIFALASVGAAFVNALVGGGVLLVVAILSGGGLAWTTPLAVIPLAALCALGGGLGLVLAAAAVRFSDSLHLARVGLQMAFYLTPTFYPLAIVPSGVQPVIEANPLTHHLAVFRSMVDPLSDATTAQWIVCLTSGPVALILGAWLFSYSWRRLVVLL